MVGVVMERSMMLLTTTTMTTTKDGKDHLSTSTSMSNNNEIGSVVSDETDCIDNRSQQHPSKHNNNNMEEDEKEDDAFHSRCEIETSNNNDNINNNIRNEATTDTYDMTERMKLWLSEIPEESTQDDFNLEDANTTNNNNNNNNNNNHGISPNSSNYMIPSDVLHGNINRAPNEITEEDAVLWMKDVMMDDDHNDTDTLPHSDDTPNLNNHNHHHHHSISSNSYHSNKDPEQNWNNGHEKRSQTNVMVMDGTTTTTTTTTDREDKNNNNNNNDFHKDHDNLERDMKRVLKEADVALEEANRTLEDARCIAQEVGLTVDSSILDASYQSPFLPTKFVHGVTLQSHDHHTTTTPEDPPLDHQSADVVHAATNNPMRGRFNAFPLVLSTTGGHSNTDHLIQCTGDPKVDRLAEYKRRLKRRARAMQPEQKGSHRWDQPRVAGGRRRRIVREKDLPSAPPEPPPSGYIIFIAQMTTKIRHDRPNVHHNQISVVREISKIWKYGMSRHDRDYYIEFAKEARDEYKQQLREFRATGHFHPSKVFCKMDGGPWIRIAYHEKNALEREIASYTTVQFPPRPHTAPVPHWVRKIEQQTARSKLRQQQKLEKQQNQQKQSKQPPSRTSPRTHKPHNQHTSTTTKSSNRKRKKTTTS